jgi:hypothetical protein
MRVTGVLGFLWRKLVAEDIMNHESDQMEALVERAKNSKK